jgi:hypothetical protein
METIVSQVYLAEFNGFYGVGKTEREAEVACAFAAATLPLEEGMGGPKTAYYHQLPPSEQAKV